MATSEERRLANEAILEIERVRSNMRKNANAYKQQIGVRTAVQIATVMKADADQFQRRLERLRRGFTTEPSRTKLIAGMVVDGVTRAELVADHTELNDAAQAVWDATITTDAQITTVADQILANVTEHETLLSKPLPTVR